MIGNNMRMAVDSNTLSYFNKSLSLLTGLLLCRDLYNDIAMPGGISNKSFVREWDGFCAAMDSNDFTKLPGHSALPLMLVSKYAGPLQFPPHSFHSCSSMMRCCHTAQHIECHANERKCYASPRKCVWLYRGCALVTEHENSSTGAKKAAADSNGSSQVRPLL